MTKETYPVKDKINREDILKKLQGGDRRSVGRVDEVVNDVLRNPILFDKLFSLIFYDDDVVRMRVADAVEKITLKNPEYLTSYKKEIIEKVSRINQQEVRWHVAQLFPRLDLNTRERGKVFYILNGFMEDKSKIVKTFSMQALADISENDKKLRTKVITLIEDMVKEGSPAMKSRGRTLLEKLNKIDST
ncbi:MAG: hypothetical protein HN931_11910 [Desulfobacterales bacterium]|nr:hypothetical protein [Desulfobacteraceae bacterium]MBT4365577.1 hypothetical protein [Desulfobacteraceae bacterium]MBT7086870.1 hypothetical protein [Desulfobacterales bacterium]